MASCANNTSCGTDSYVVLDDKGNEIKEESSAGLKMSPNDDLKSLNYFMELFAICSIGGGVYSLMIYFDKIFALQIMLGLLLVQVLYAMRMRRPFGLPIMEYVSGRGVNAALDEVIEKRECGKLRPIYVVTYVTPDENGKKITVRKTFKPDVFSGVRGNAAITEQVAMDIGFVTRVQIAKGCPKSAHPRRSVLNRYEALREWNMYFSPVLILTILAICINIYMSLKSLEVNQYDLFQVLKVYAIVYPVVIGFFGLYSYRWANEVLFGGEIVESIA